LCCNFSYGFAHLENLFVARLSFRLLYAHKQFRSRFVALAENVPDLKQLLKDVFIRTKHQSIWDSLFIFVMLTKCCIFAIKTEL